MLTGENEPTRGEVRRNHALRIGVYNQHSAEQLGATLTPVDYLRREFDMDQQNARRNLGRFGLEGHAHTIPMKDLSGGQKARVVFAELANRHPDILILDEPTNNLDIESIDALIEALKEYEGGVVVVSHDARLIRECECTLYECADQTLTELTMDFDDYHDHILETLEDDSVVVVEGRRVGLADEHGAAGDAAAPEAPPEKDGTAEVWG